MSELLMGSCQFGPAAAVPTGVASGGFPLTFAKVAQPAPDILCLYVRVGELLVRVRADGSIEYGPNYTPDTAAQAFWDALARAGFARART